MGTVGESVGIKGKGRKTEGTWFWSFGGSSWGQQVRLDSGGRKGGWRMAVGSHWPGLTQVHVSLAL